MRPAGLHGRIEAEGAGGRAAAEFDAVWARAVGAKLSSVDIVNISTGTVYPCSAVGSEFAAVCRREFLRLHDEARRALPRTASAIAQAGIPDDGKTIVVWAAGNLRGVLGDGARVEAMELVSRFEELRGHNIGVTALDGEGRGAFSLAAGSSLLAVQVERRFALDDAGRWSLGATASLALDLPWGLGTRSGSMFDAGSTVISSWRLGLERREDGRRDRLTVEQPARVEAGTGHLRFPSGRRVDGGRTFEQVAFSLRPTSRTVTTRWSHSRPVGPGDGIFSVFHSRHPGHARSLDDLGAGVAWRVVW